MKKEITREQKSKNRKKLFKNILLLIIFVFIIRYVIGTIKYSKINSEQMIINNEILFGNYPTRKEGFFKDENYLKRHAILEKVITTNSGGINLDEQSGEKK
ncbi:MAG: hypothetical protein ACRCSK_00285 [Fusobacteriaceae bacterium]